MAYSLDAFNQLAAKAKAENRRITQAEFEGIGGSAQDFAGIYGPTTPPSTPTIQGGQNLTGDALRVPTAAPAIDLNAARASLQQQVASKGITQKQMDAELQRLQGINASSQSPLTGQPINNAGNPYLNIQNPKDAMSTIGGQFQANQFNALQQMLGNRVQEVGPYGSAAYSLNPDGSVKREYKLSDPQQQILDQQQQRDLQLGNLGSGALSQLGQNYRQPFDQSQLPGRPNAPDYSKLPGLPGQGDLLGERRRIEGDLYNTFSRRQEPQFEKEQDALRQRLADQGVPMGSQLHKLSMDELSQRHNDARLDAQSRATQFGGDEYTRSFGIGLDTRRQYGTEANSAFDYGNQARQNAIQENAYFRDRPFGEVSNLLGLQRGITNPTFSPISNINFQPLDVAGIGTNFAGFANQKNIASAGNAAALRQAQLAADTSRYNAGLAANTSIANQNSSNQNRLDLLNQQNLYDQQNKPKTPGFGDSLIGLGGSLASGFLSGLGSSIFR